MWHNVRHLNIAASLLFVLAAGLWLTSGAVWLIRRPMFALRQIHIDGDTAHINLPIVRADIAGRLRGNFFTMDLDATRVVFETMPWVRSASVRRLWPDQMNVTLEEYQPLGTWGESQLVSTDGDVFTVNQGEVDTNALPSFTGPSGSAKDVLNKYRELTQWFAPLGISPVQVNLSPRYAWSVKFSNGMNVELGREFDNKTLAQRCARLIGAWSQLLKSWGTRIRSVDLRYPNGFAVRLADSATANMPSVANRTIY